MSLSPALAAWIDALAEQDASDYLTAEAARLRAQDAERTERVPLPRVEKAA